MGADILLLWALSVAWLEYRVARFAWKRQMLFTKWDIELKIKMFLGIQSKYQIC
jgi:hypothetical protein